MKGRRKCQQTISIIHLGIVAYAFPIGFRGTGLGECLEDGGHVDLYGCGAGQDKSFVLDLAMALHKRDVYVRGSRGCGVWRWVPGTER
jgi:hypothetical protein